MESFKFKLDPLFQTDIKSSKKKYVNKPPRATWVTPHNLSNLTQNISDFAPLPEAFKWSNKDVLKWIEKLGFPQYKNTFRENIIIGRRLMMVDANALVRMNITDFNHIKKITESIRQIFQIEYPEFKRSISLPPNLPDTQFKQYRVSNGPKYELPRRSDVLRKYKILGEKMDKDHWTQLYEWLQQKPDFQNVRIGNIPRPNLYFVKYHKSEPSNNLESEICCECIPPCECGWKDYYYKASGKLSYLK